MNNLIQNGRRINQELQNLKPEKQRLTQEKRDILQKIDNATLIIEKRPLNQQKQQIVQRLQNVTEKIKSLNFDKEMNISDKRQFRERVQLLQVVKQQKF